MTKYTGTAVPSPCAGASFCKVLVVAIGAIATAGAIAERDGSYISSQNHWQTPEDGGDGQNVHNLLSQKSLVDQF